MGLRQQRERLKVGAVMPQQKLDGLVEDSLNEENKDKYGAKHDAWSKIANSSSPIQATTNLSEYSSKTLDKYFGKSVVKSRDSGIIKAEREMANGMRRSFKIPLSENEKNFIRKEIEEIGATQEVFVFRDGLPTGYSDVRDIIYVSSSVFPPNDGSTHPTDRLSVRATLAHEYYGHRAHRNTKLPAGVWNDEFRASYSAAKNCPNLTDEDRASLIADAIERANKAGVTIKLNSFMRRCLYGYE